MASFLIVQSGIDFSGYSATETCDTRGHLKKKIMKYDESLHLHLSLPRYSDTVEFN